MKVNERWERMMNHRGRGFHNSGMDSNPCLIALIVSAVFVIPFFFTRLTIDPVLAPRFLLWGLANLLLLMLMTWQARRNRFRFDFSIGRRKIFYAALGYAFFSGVSLSQAHNPGEGVFELLKILQGILFLFLATTVLVDSRNGIAVLVKAISLMAIGLAGIGICQYYLIAFNSIPGNYLVYATMANKNLFASFLLLAVPFVLYGVLEFSGCWNATSRLALTLITFCLFIAHTRAVWLAVLATSAAAIVFLILKRQSIKISLEVKAYYRKRFALAGLLVVASVLIAAFLHPQHAASDARVAYAFNRPASSIDERLVLWSKTLRMVKDHPLLGVGLGNWKIVMPRYGLEGTRAEQGLIHFQQPHNEYLTVLSEAGPFALLAFLGTFSIAFLYAYKIVTHHEAPARDRLVAVLMLCGVLGFAIVACFDFPKERIEHNIFLMLLMAVVLSVYHRLFPLPERRMRGLQVIFFGSTVVLVSVSLSIGYLRCRAEFHARRALQARETKQWENVIAEIDRGKSHFANLDPTAAPLSWYKGVAKYSLQRIDEALEEFQAAHVAHPYHLYTLNNLASCYELKGDHDNAIKYYQRALAISPRFEEALLNLSAVYYNLAEYEKAYNLLLRCDPESRNARVQSYLETVRSKLNE